MIICVSTNPAIDRRLRIRDLKIGAVNRAVSVEAFAGGKAAHVAMAARALGEDVIWVGFLGGAIGDEIERQLIGLGIEVIAVQTVSATRINDEIVDENGRITEILEPGGNIGGEELEEMHASCRRVFAEAKNDFQVVFSGSLPPNVPNDFYADLVLSARAGGGKTILDTSGKPFLSALKAGPDLIKPNLEEAEKALNLKIEDNTLAVAAVRNLLEKGARNVALSMGSRGVLLTNGETNRTILATPPSVKIVSTVGCGDATVAGFAVAAQRNLSEAETLRLAVACGTANCLAKLPGQINARDVKRLQELVSLKEIESVNESILGEKLC